MSFLIFFLYPSFLLGSATPTAPFLPDPLNEELTLSTANTSPITACSFRPFLKIRLFWQQMEAILEYLLLWIAAYVSLGRINFFGMSVWTLLIYSIILELDVWKNKFPACCLLLVNILSRALNIQRSRITSID